MFKLDDRVIALNVSIYDYLLIDLSFLTALGIHTIYMYKIWTFFLLYITLLRGFFFSFSPIINYDNNNMSLGKI